MRKVLRYGLLTLLAVVVIFPIYITVVNSLLSPQEITSRPPTLFPTSPDWGAYSDAWNAGNMSQYLVNSAIVTAIITVGHTFKSKIDSSSLLELGADAAQHLVQVLVERGDIQLGQLFPRG